MRKLGAALLAAIAVSGTAASPAAGRRPAAVPDHVTLVYAADVAGYLEPCGCSQDQRGGLARAAAALARIRAEGQPVLFVGGGDLLFESAPSAESRAQDLLKARAVAQAFRKMGLAATVAGERDLFAGAAFASEVGLRFAPARLGAVGFGDLGRVPGAPVRVGVVHEGGTRAALLRAEEAKRAGVILVFASHRDDLLADDVNRALLDAPVPVVQVQGRGQSLARVDLFLRGDRSRGFAVVTGAAERDEEVDLAEERRLEYLRRREGALAAGQAELARALAAKIAELEARARELRTRPLPEPPADRPSLRVSFVPLVPSMPEDGDVRAIVTRYYREVAKRNLALARSAGKPCPAPAAGSPSYIGAESALPGEAGSCRTCHAAAYDQWKTTPHAAAFETLSRVGRQYDLDCISCHVTGWQKPGGACNVAATRGRTDVQCEACHGPASLHAADPPGHIERAPSEERCRSCHTPERSTHFEFTSYRQRVIGPGHGRSR